MSETKFGGLFRRLRAWYRFFLKKDSEHSNISNVHHGHVTHSRMTWAIENGKGKEVRIHIWVLVTYSDLIVYWFFFKRLSWFKILKYWKNIILQKIQIRQPFRLSFFHGNKPLLFERKQKWIDISRETLWNFDIN